MLNTFIAALDCQQPAGSCLRHQRRGTAATQQHPDWGAPAGRTLRV